MAAARQTSAASNRTQLIIGAVAVTLIAVVIIVGLVLNKVQNASPVTDHPRSTNSTASLQDGTITVTGGTPTLTVDLYEDGLCPACQTFEGQYGQQIMKAVDEGKLAVRYHLLNFLDKASASKNYSTRAAAALRCVAAVPAAQAPKGLWMNFHTTMFSSGVQPAENGSSDLSDAQLADLAVKAGAPQSAATCITSGTQRAAASTAAGTSATKLASLVPGGSYSTPSATRGDQLLDVNTVHWLTDLLA